MDKLCTICLREKDLHQIKCEDCKLRKMPLRVSLDCETYPNKNKNG